MARRKKHRQMNQPLQKPPDGSKLGEGIASLFKSKPVPYVPITKSLEQIEMTPTMLDLDIGNGMEPCMVLPVQKLIYQEWRHMTGSEFVVNQPQIEREEVNEQFIPEYSAGQITDEQNLGPDPEVGGPSDVQGGSN